jgi:uncharacterized membrane protein
MFEESHRPLLSPSRFAVRMMGFMIVAVCVDGVGLAIGAIGYHFLEWLEWLDASLNAALVMTGNEPIHAPHIAAGKLFSISYAMMGVILFAAVIGVLLTPVFHRMLHGFHNRSGENHERNEQATARAGEHQPVSAGERT